MMMELALLIFCVIGVFVLMLAAMIGSMGISGTLILFGSFTILALISVGLSKLIQKRWKS